MNPKGASDFTEMTARRPIEPVPALYNHMPCKTQEGGVWQPPHIMQRPEILLEEPG